MVPFASLATIRETAAPLVVSRYNMYLAAGITGNFAPGVSSGDAIAVAEAIAKQELPESMAPEWSELTYLETTGQKVKLPSILNGFAWSAYLKEKLTSTALIFAGAVMFVFLVLAALYESWKLPLAVILVVPMCVLGSLTGVDIAEQDINIFTQIGFVVLVGLACKNAILIVEFAKMRREEGATRRDATLEACQLRYRPILMTSCAFILGVLPLVVATGAGAEMRTALGTAVFSGMIGVTLFGIFLTPVFFFLIDEFRSFARASARMTLLALSAGFIVVDKDALWKPRWNVRAIDFVRRRIGRLAAWSMRCWEHADGERPRRARHHRACPSVAMTGRLEGAMHQGSPPPGLSRWSDDWQAIDKSGAAYSVSLAGQSSPHRDKPGGGGEREGIL